MKKEERTEVDSLREWNTLRKRLISAKIREIEDEKIRLVDICIEFLPKTTTTFILFTASTTAPSLWSVRLVMEASAAFTTSMTRVDGALLSRLSIS